VGSGGEGEGAVLSSTVLEGEPKATCGEGLGVEEGGVLVGRHLSTDLRLLEDQHGLQDARVPEIEVVGEVLHLLGQGQCTELGL